MGDHETPVAESGENYESITPETTLPRHSRRYEIDEDTIDPRDIHATDRTYGAAIRTIFQLLVLSVAIGRQFTTSTTVVSAFFLAYALALLLFSGIRHHLNLRSIKRGVVRVDGVTPLFFFVLGLGATVAALVYTAQRIAEPE